MAIRFQLKAQIELKEFREKRKLPYRVIAQESGVSTNTLSQMANQKMKMIGVITLDKLCRYFSCNPGDLIAFISDNGNLKR